MPVVKVKDDSGFTITLRTSRRTGEVNMPSFQFPGYNQEEEINAFDTWETRDDDIILCAYPRSGTHWIWEILCMLVNGNAKRIPVRKEKGMLEALSKVEFDALQSPRVLNSHLHCKYWPEDFHKKRCKVIYVMRNPKDVAVSFYNLHKKHVIYEYDGSWNDYLPRFLKGGVDFGRWTEHVSNWNKGISEDHPTLYVSYEDVKTDIINEIGRIAHFLDIPKNKTLFESIAEACSFDNMKKDKDLIAPADEWKDKSSGMFRKGEVGDWKNWFTVAQNEMFNSTVREGIKTEDLPFKYGF